MSFFIKAVVMIAAVLSFAATVFFFHSSQISTIKEKEKSELRMEAMEILQKLINKRENLAYVYDNVTQKGNLDIRKIINFVGSYSHTEPDTAKALNFDYKIEIMQYPRNFTLYPGKKWEEKEVNMRYLCSDPGYGDEFILIICNYDPENCSDICEECGEFDECSIPDCPASCGKNPLKNCPYNGSCDVTDCPTSSSPDPSKEVCCRYLRCPRVGTCDYVVNTHFPHSTCWVGFGNCDLSKCTDVGCTRGTGSWDHGHCTKGKIPIPIPSAKMINITIPIRKWGFGVGFGTSSFSPEGAIQSKEEVVLPVVIRYNATTMRGGLIKITAVRGELETLNSLIEDVCLKAEKNPGKEIKVLRDLYFSYPVSYDGTYLNMVDGKKIPDCNYPIEFDNIEREGEQSVEIRYDPSSSKIFIKT